MLDPAVGLDGELDMYTRSTAVQAANRLMRLARRSLL
jgi:hypothetical protein